MNKDLTGPDFKHVKSSPICTVPAVRTHRNGSEINPEQVEWVFLPHDDEELIILKTENGDQYIFSKGNLLQAIL